MENNNKSISVGFLGILQIVFITLKILKLISWPWWKVFIPLWIELAIVLLVVIILIIKDVKEKHGHHK